MTVKSIFLSVPLENKIELCVRLLILYTGREILMVRSFQTHPVISYFVLGYYTTKLLTMFFLIEAK